MFITNHDTKNIGYVAILFHTFFILFFSVIVISKACKIAIHIVIRENFIPPIIEKAYFAGEIINLIMSKNVTNKDINIIGIPSEYIAPSSNIGVKSFLYTRFGKQTLKH